MLTLNLFASCLFLWGGSEDATERCEVEIPAGIHLEQKVRTIQANRQSFAVCAGAAVTFLGTDNLIFIVKGAATITGTGNTIYVRPLCSATVTGAGNRIYAAVEATVVNTNPDSQLLTCKEVVFKNFDVSSCQPVSGDSMPADKKKLRTSVIDWVPKKTYKLAEEAKADPADTLIGTWLVTGALFEKEEYPGVGKVIFYKGGKGYQDFQVQIATRASLEKGAFDWRHDAGQIFLETEGKKVVWKQLLDEANQQEVALTTAAGVNMVLRLKRKR